MRLQIRSSQRRDGSPARRRTASAVRRSFARVATAAACAGACSFSCSDRESTPSDRVRVKLPADPGGGDQDRSDDDEAGQCAADCSGGDANSSVDPAAGCKTDDDCRRVDKGCCHLGNFIAITKANASAYQAGLACEGKVCPMIMIPDDHSVAQCDVQAHACKVVLPKDVACNGPTTNPHACPQGWRCRLPGSVADVAGSCVQMCGGFAAIHCGEPNAQCVDDPDDSCDPKNGGADCAGICMSANP